MQYPQLELFSSGLRQSDGPCQHLGVGRVLHRTSINAVHPQPDDHKYSCCSSPSTSSSPLDPSSSSGSSDSSDQQGTSLAISSASDHPAYTGHSLQFHNICYWLKPAKASCFKRWLRCTGKHDISSDSSSSFDLDDRHGSQLLRDVSGTACSGRLLAVMGPSGAGKTTLLSLLAGDHDTMSSGHMTGRILLGGQQAQLKRSGGVHVKQDDALLSTTTPREALTFAAALKLPSPAFTRQQRAAAVDELLDGMRLTKCADTLVGDTGVGVKGLSGGERRRLSVAVELLGKPGLALMDEPSSGQDSSTAQQVISFIKQTVLCGHNGSSSHSSSIRHPGILVITVHQPGSEITSLIDDVMLLTAQGRVAYCGPWSCALPYFQQHLQLSPPPHTGLAEWFLMLISNSQQQDSSTDRDSSSGQQSSGVRPASPAAASGCAALADAWQALTSPDCAVDGSSSSSSSDTVVGGSWCQQQQWLSMLRDSTPGQPLHSSGEMLLQVVTVTAADEDYLSGTVTPVAAAAADQSGTTTLAAVAGEECTAGGMHQHKHALKHVATPWSLADEFSNGSSSSSRIKTAHPDLSGAQSGSSSSSSSVRCKAGFWVQVGTLAGRTLRFWWRNPALVLSEAVQYLFVVLFVGSVYPRMSVTGQSAVVDRLAVMFMWVTALLVTAPARALIAWDMERRLLRHELSSDTYCLTAFLVGTKLLTAVPLEGTLVAAAAALLYFMLGLQLTAAKFGAWLLLSVLCALSSSNMGNMIGLLTPDLNLALPILAVSATMLLAFAGFMVSVVPAWWSWLHEASFASYAYAGIVRNEFEGLVLQMPAADALKPASAATMGSNALVAAAQQTLQSAVAAAGANGSSSMLGSQSAAAAAAAAAASGTVAVDGLLVIPQTIKVGATSVWGFIGYMMMFFVGTTLLCIVSTVLMVRIRMR